MFFNHAFFRKDNMIKTNNLFQIICRIITGLLETLFILIVCLFGYIMIARALGKKLPTIFGWSSAVVLSGSMEPELPVGSLLLIHNEDNYKIGDIVTYEDEYGNLVTHRLVSIENGEVITKGDANNTNDKPFPETKIYGKVKAVMPRVGSMILWLKTPVGICTILLIGGILIFTQVIIIRKVGDIHGRKKE